MRIQGLLAALCKRIFQRPGFLVLLALIPALTLIYTCATRQDAGMVTVALAQEDSQDALAQSICTGLPKKSQLLRFVVCQSPEAAKGQVEAGKADMAWVFHRGTQENIRHFIRTRSQHDAFVTIYQREDTVLNLLARERLNAEVFACITQQLYLAQLQESGDALSAMDESTRLEFWENACIPGQLFAFSQGGAPVVAQYLLSPLRGLLAVLLLLGSLSQGMYHRQDRENGTYDALPYRLRWLPEWMEGMLSQLLLCAGVLSALALAGLTGNLLREGALLLGYALAVTSFSMALGRLIPRNNGMAAALPVVVTVSLVACPVFFQVEALAPLGALLPVGHYLYAAVGARSALWLLLYSALCLGIAFIPEKPFRRKGI